MMTANMVMIKLAGKTQTAKVKNAKVGPPILKPIAVMVWVEVGPGSMLQKEFSSFKSSGVMYFFLFTSNF